MLIGAHTSTAGGLYKALLEGASIGATTIQIFTANQRRWHTHPLSDETLSLWNKHLDATGISSVMSHASYLLNLASVNPELWEKSCKGMREEILRCQKLHVKYLNFHPGSSVNSTRGEGLERIVKALSSMKDLFDTPSPYLLFEMTAGQGHCLGSTLEEIAYLVHALKNDLPVGVCVDTCHIFAAGYDIRTKSQVREFLNRFDELIGIKYLKALHLNDSLGKLASHKDRHLPLGKGEIGLECFEALMQEPRLKKLPKYLETPDGPPLWREEIALLKTFVH